MNPDRSAATAPMWSSGGVLLEKHQCLLALLTWQVILLHSDHSTLISRAATLDIDFPLHLITVRSKCANWVCRGTYMYWIGVRKIIGNKKIYPIAYCHNESSQICCFAVINIGHFAYQYVNSKPVLMYACCIRVCSLKIIACWLFLFNVMFKLFIYSAFRNVIWNLLWCSDFCLCLRGLHWPFFLPRQKIWMWENCEWAFRLSWRSISLPRWERIKMENVFTPVLPTSPFHLLNVLQNLSVRRVG